VERARATWTDERLDDLARRMDDGFKRVDEDIRSLRVELSGGVDSLEARMDSGFDALNSRFDAMQRTMIQVGGGMTAAILATLLTVILTQA
jgi:hypothetical protein